MTSLGETFLWSSYMFLANSMSTATYDTDIVNKDDGSLWAVVNFVFEE